MCNQRATPGSSSALGGAFKKSFTSNPTCFMCCPAFILSPRRPNPSPPSIAGASAKPDMLSQRQGREHERGRRAEAVYLEVGVRVVDLCSYYLCVWQFGVIPSDYTARLYRESTVWLIKKKKEQKKYRTAVPTKTAKKTHTLLFICNKINTLRNSPQPTHKPHTRFISFTKNKE